MNTGNFFAELQRRNVYKVAAAYAVVGGLVIQIATQVFPFFDIPNWAVRLVVLAILTGFPVALVIAWAFELGRFHPRFEVLLSLRTAATKETER